MDHKDLEIKKSIMTHIHIILGNAPEKKHTFNSLEDLYAKVSFSIGSAREYECSGYYGTELLDSLNASIKWMKKRGIIIFRTDNSGESSTVRIDKEKLIKYIIDPDINIDDSSNDN